MEPSYLGIVDQALPILIQYPSNMAETISSERRRLEFRILGSLEVSTADASLSLTGKKRRSLLVRLLLAPNQPVSDDRLAFDLWTGSPPAGAASTLASHVSLLRQVLGADRIVHRAGGYCLEVGAHELDSSEFEADVIAGQAADRQGRPQLAVDRFERGLRRWRGAALADVDGASWAHSEIARLEELRLGAVESLLRSQLALGRHGEILAAAESAVRDNPLRERGWAILMTALYRSGRQAEALRAYQRLRAELAEQLGVEPSPELAELEESMILQRPDLRWPTEARPPTSSRPTSAVRPELATVLAATNETDPGSLGSTGPVVDTLVAQGGRVVETGSGGVFALFPSPFGALSAGVALRALAVGTRGGGLQIGLAIGEVVDIDGAYAGTPIDEAIDLARRAHASEILVTEHVQAMSGPNCPWSFHAIETGPRSWVSSNGAILSVDRSPTTPESGPLPLVDALRESDTPFVGRVSQRTDLDGFASLAGTGARQTVLITGEPGIGKTSLVASLARQLHADGGTVLYGRCLEIGRHPYQPFSEALGYYVEHAPPEALRDHVARFGGDLVRLVPALTRRYPDTPPPTNSDPDTERFLAFRAAVGLVTAASRRHSVLLVLEDLHWADAGTLALLHRLTGDLDQSAMLVVGTYRSTELTADHPLAPVLAALWREPGVSRIDLDGLSVPEVLQLCRSMTAAGLDEATAATRAADLQSETAGNPFFITELLRSMAEAGGTEEVDESHSALPVSILDVINQRIHRLGTKTERVLSFASVIGEIFEPSTLAAMTDVRPDALLDLLGDAERAAILTTNASTGSFAFAHALVRRALYGEIPAARQRQLHARLTNVLEGQGAASSLLAHHYLAAGDDEHALARAERAGYDANTAMAPNEASRWFGTAVDLLERLHPEQLLRRCDLKTQWGISLRLAGDASYREMLLEAAAAAGECGDGRRMAVAALANTRGYYSAAGQRDEDRIDSLQRAVQLLGTSDPLLRARLLATVSSESVFGTSLAQRRLLAHEAKDAARALGDPETILEVDNLVIEGLRFPSELPNRLEDTRTALHLAERSDDPSQLFWAIGHRMRTLVEAGEIAEARVLFRRMAEVSERLGQPFMQWMTLFSRAQWSFLRGDTAIGEELSDEALRLGSEIGQPDAFNYYATQISHARWQQGRLAEIVELIEQGMADNPGIPSYQGALARAYCQAGRPADAEALLASATDQRFANLPEDLLWSYGMVTFAEAAIQIEHVESAVILFEKLSPYEDQVCFLGTTCEGPIAHYLGGLAAVLGQPDNARRHLQRSSEFAQLAESPFFASRASIEQGRLEARSGNTDLARHLLELGLGLAHNGGFTGEGGRAEAALAGL
jgi:DNA-binding SARP family transcriptional activator